MLAAGSPDSGGNSAKDLSQVDQPLQSSRGQQLVSSWCHWARQPCCGPRRCTRGAACCAAAVTCALLLFLGMGILAGRSAGRNSSSSSSAQPAGVQQSNGTQELLARMSPAEAAALRGNYKDLHLLDSPEAQALLKDQGVTGSQAQMQDMYRQMQDHANITRAVCERFLVALDAAAQRSNLPSFSRDEFIQVANSVVTLLWMLRADALLTLLRQYAATGKLDVTAVDQDQLVKDVENVLQTPVLEMYYRRMAVRESENTGGVNLWQEFLTQFQANRSAAAADMNNQKRRLSSMLPQRSNSRALPGDLTAKQQLQRAVHDGGANLAATHLQQLPARRNPHSRRLLQPPIGATVTAPPAAVLPAISSSSSNVSNSSAAGRAPLPGVRSNSSNSTNSSSAINVAEAARASEESLAAALASIPGAASTPVPVITPEQAAANATLATAAPLQTLGSMLCVAQRFQNDSAALLEKLRRQGAPSSKLTANSSTQVLQVLANCSAPPAGRLFDYGDIKFRPVLLPVVFHGLRFLDDEGYLHPDYGPSSDPTNNTAAAQHLISRANVLLNGTGVQLLLQDVRTDPALHPYLLIPGGLAAWQACTASDSNGIACVSNLMQENAAEGYALNVVLSGSQANAAYCNVKDPKDPCGNLALGLCGAAGPWMPTPNPGWSEDNKALNWIWTLWDMFAPQFRNSDDHFNGGAVTLAHEAGHYLGLRHTHQGGCAGDGFLPAGDEVPDTPINKDINVIYDPRQYHVLEGWCQRYRMGLLPSLDGLAAFKSCTNEPAAYLDNVFNMMSYLPDACTLIFTENQKARLQWAVASFRPRMMAAFQA